jgi:germination protein M
MNLRVLLIVIAVLASVALLAWVVYPGREPATFPTRPDGELLIEPTPTPPPVQRIVLLFAGEDGRLHPELREVALPAAVHDRARTVVGELLAGPTGDLHPVVPYPAQVNSVYVDGSGHAFVDLTAPPEPLEGSSVELMLAYGVVDSILLNCPELTAVQLLFDGREVPTLTGHLDLSRPLVLNKRFIAAS